MVDLRIPHPPAGNTATAPDTGSTAAPSSDLYVATSSPRRRASSGPRVPGFVPVAAVVAGLVLLSALGWQQWGSNWWAARAQAELAAEFDEGTPGFVNAAGTPLSALAAAPAPAAGDAAPGFAAAAPTAPAAPQEVTPQGAIARITAPSIDLNRVVVDGVGVADLRKGPGWMPGTAPIGEAGNTVISGHRTTYGAPFRHLDRLKVGDRIKVETVGGVTAVYEVRDSFVVKPGDVWVAEPTPGARLTLTTCHPVGSDRERLVVQAEMVDGPASGAALPASSWSRSAR